MEIKDDLISAVFSGTDFGERAKDLEGQKRFLAQKIFAFAAGYSSGSTITGIMRQLKLLPPEAKTNNLRDLKNAHKPGWEACRWAYGILFNGRE